MSRFNHSSIRTTGPWWNRNTELQAYGRAHRHGQQEHVQVYSLHGTNSAIDNEMRKVRDAKTNVICEIMQHVFRRDDDEPLIETAS